MTEAAIIKNICANNGSIAYADLLSALGMYDEAQDVLDVLISRSENCTVGFFSGQKRVIVRTKVRLCRIQNCPACDNLHLCKGFLFGFCRFDRGRRGCRFSHDLDSAHNLMVLMANGLNTLDLKELRILLLQSDNTLLPAVCHSYNNGVGEYGRCPDAEACKRLHICERYLQGHCDCTRAHDFYEPHPLKTLQDRGVPTELMALMKDLYSNIEALRRTNRNKPNTAPNNRRGPNVNNRRSSSVEFTAANRETEAPATQHTYTEKSEICMYFIKGHCKHGGTCRREHSILPYKWEVKEGSVWKALPDNEAIEKDYCDPTNIYSSGRFPVCFDTMTQGCVAVRRLSTVSSVLQPSFILTTEWLWFWEDEFGNWIQYASADGGHKISSITSAELEQKYQADQSAVLEFSAGSQTYTLSFQDMIQTNKQYKTKKVIRRRPKFVSAADVKTIKSTKRAPISFKTLPEHWDKALTPETGCKRVQLTKTTAEFIKIQELFNRTMRGFTIQNIERIQNKALWEVFQWQKDCMKKNSRGRDVSEKQLFHGTDSKFVDTICLNNFDWRICGVNGTAYGKGSYFARDAKYSHSYTNNSGTRSMFVCRILVGDYTKGDSSYLRPPSKDGGDTVFYDSCVNDVCDPSIFVVFEKHQIYPEYLIQYRDSSEWASPAVRPAVTTTRAVPASIRTTPSYNSSHFTSSNTSSSVKSSHVASSNTSSWVNSSPFNSSPNTASSYNSTSFAYSNSASTTNSSPFNSSPSTSSYVHLSRSASVYSPPPRKPAKAENSCVIS